MRPLCFTKEDLGDQKFKFTFSDKHKSAHKPDEETASFELTVDNGILKKMDISYNDEKKMGLDFFFGNMGRAMKYDLLDDKLELSEQLRLGITQYLQPGLHYLGRIVTDYLYPRVFHRYSDGATMGMFYNPFDMEHPVSFCLSNPGSSTTEQDTHYAFFAFDKEKGLVERRPRRGDLLEVKDMSKKEEKPVVKKEDTLKMQKMAIFAELDTLTPSQQRDVLSTVQAKLNLYRSNYGKE